MVSLSALCNLFVIFVFTLNLFQFSFHKINLSFDIGIFLQSRMCMFSLFFNLNFFLFAFNRKKIATFYLIFIFLSICF